MAFAVLGFAAIIGMIIYSASVIVSYLDLEDVVDR
jgi:hypothetical protein